MVLEGAVPRVGGVRDHRKMWAAQKKPHSTEWDELKFGINYHCSHNKPACAKRLQCGL